MLKQGQSTILEKHIVVQLLWTAPLERTWSLFYIVIFFKSPLPRVSCLYQSS